MLIDRELYRKIEELKIHRPDQAPVVTYNDAIQDVLDLMRIHCMGVTDQPVGLTDDEIISKMCRAASDARVIHRGRDITEQAGVIDRTFTKMKAAFEVVRPYLPTRERESVTPILTLENSGFSVRLKNCLSNELCGEWLPERLGIKPLDGWKEAKKYPLHNLNIITDREFLMMPNFGKVCLSEIRKTITQIEVGGSNGN